MVGVEFAYKISVFDHFQWEAILERGSGKYEKINVSFERMKLTVSDVSQFRRIICHTCNNVISSIRSNAHSKVHHI